MNAGVGVAGIDVTVSVVVGDVCAVVVSSSALLVNGLLYVSEVSAEIDEPVFDKR